MVDAVRRALGTRRVGHAGTLDPFASGLLLVLVGRATRLSQYLVGLSKEYSGTVVLGRRTDTDDRTGSDVASSDVWRSISDNDAVDAMAALTGTQRQLPPPYSAKKVSGERAHRLARRGIAVTLPPQEVEIYRFELEQRDGARIRFTATVSTGAYIRALARDLGERLGCGAHLESLRRTAIGPFQVDAATPLDAIASTVPLPVRSARDAVRHLPTIALDTIRRTAVSHGQPVPHPGTETQPIALVSGDALIAIAEREGDLLKPRVVFEG